MQIKTVLVDLSMLKIKCFHNCVCKLRLCKHMICVISVTCTIANCDVQLVFGFLQHLFLVMYRQDKRDLAIMMNRESCFRALLEQRDKIIKTQTGIIDSYKEMEPKKT